MITPGHKRALNRALHELRRPLQALILLEEAPDGPAAAPPAASRRGLLELATGALRDLDGALNGAEPPRPPQRFSSRDVVLGCLERTPQLVKGPVERTLVSWRDHPSRSL